ncbi:MAG: ABC transporter ATP-binding protein, partial [Caldilineaceae bacterium]|nr:ABC transporter ATP-binding protein [Caldilineaceae bacterium]
MVLQPTLPLGARTTMSATPKLRVDHVWKTFVTSRGQDVVALEDLSLTVGENEFVSLVGPSGCGKSTLLMMAAGLEETTAGEMFIGDRAIDGPGPDRGMVFQSYTLFPWLTVEENIRFALKKSGLDRAGQTRLVQEHIRLVGLEGFERAHPNQLSGGMRQRVTIALATLLGPTIIVGDEPTTALDVVVQRGVVQLLKNVQSNLQNTIVLVTHDMGVHVNAADRIGIMYAGKIVEEATTEKIFGQPEHPYTQYLINSLPKFGDKTPRESVPGSPPSLAELPPGCPFHPRCPLVKDICKQTMQGFTEIARDHKVACWLVRERDHGSTA